MFDYSKVLKKMVYPFFKNEKGAVIAIFAVAAIPILAFAGLSIDAGRAYYAHSVIAGAVDAAAIAGGRATQSTSTAQATMMFNANIPPTFIGTPSPPSVSDNGTQVTVSASATLPTTLMQLVGQNSMTVTATSQVQREYPGLEIVLVMDNTGSMSSSAGSGGAKIDAMKAAAKTLVSLLACNSSTSCSSGTNFSAGTYVGLVPYTTTVKIGTGTGYVWQNWLIQSALASSPKAAIGTGTGQGMVAYPSGSRNPVVQSWTTPTLPEFVFTGNPTPVYNPTNSYFTYGNFWTATTTTATTSTGSGRNKVTTIKSPATTTFSSRGAWTGCVLARLDNTSGTNGVFKKSVDGDGEGDETPPGASDATRWGVYDNITETSGCPQQQIVALQKSYSTVTTAINNMAASGSTAVNIGLAWGYRMLSPQWQGLWVGGGNLNAASPAVNAKGQSVTLPQNYGTVNKAIILLTDGYNQISGYTGYGTATPSNPSGTYPGANATGNNSPVFQAPYPMVPSAQGTLVTPGSTGDYQGVLDKRLGNLCKNIKDNGIIIYTILLGVDVNSSAATAMRNCASIVNGQTYYYPSPNSSQLQGIFQQIAGSLSQLRYRWPGKP